MPCAALHVMHKASFLRRTAGGGRIASTVTALLACAALMAATSGRLPRADEEPPPLTCPLCGGDANLHERVTGLLIQASADALTAGFLASVR